MGIGAESSLTIVHVITWPRARVTGLPFTAAPGQAQPLAVYPSGPTSSNEYGTPAYTGSGAPASPAFERSRSDECCVAVADNVHAVNIIGDPVPGQPAEVFGVVDTILGGRNPGQRGRGDHK